MIVCGRSSIGLVDGLTIAEDLLPLGSHFPLTSTVIVITHAPAFD